MEPVYLAVLLGMIIGIVLALTGAGGGMLAIPLLVFVLHLPVQQAAPVGLIAVGAAAAIGTALGLKQGIVRYRAATMIGTAGMLIAPLGVLVAQRLPNQPMLAAFAVLLAYSAWRMLSHPALAVPGPAAPCLLNSSKIRLTWTPRCAFTLAGIGMLSGLLSGLFGIGGGFVIIPALTRFSDLDIRSIQATSLAVMALVALSGVSASAVQGSLRWDVALPFGAGAVLALLAGRYIANQLNTSTLQRGFGWLTALIALLMLARAFGLDS